MNILCLDLATKVGWAMLLNGRTESGMQDFTKRRGESNGMLFVHFNAWLDRISFPWVGWNLCVWEQAHHRGGAATEIGVGLSTRMLEFCARHHVEHATVHSMTLKKWSCGTGKADKSEMVKRASSMSGRIIEDDNEADSYLLLQYAIKEIVGGNACNVQSAAAKCELPTPSALPAR